jgi:DNA polymerase III delta subunit
MAKSTGPFVVVYGDEDFLLDRFVERRKTAWKSRYVRVRDGATIKESELVNLCETQTMFDEDGRVVILDNAQDLKTEKALEAYIAERDPKDMSCILLAVVRAKKLPAVWNEALKKGAQASYFKFRPWETQKVLDRIEEEAKSFNLKLDGGVPELIFRSLGDDLRTTVNELQKLSYIVGADGLVKKEHVSKVIAINVPVEAYQVADAAIAKNARQAMSTMSLVYKALGESSCVPVTSGLLRQVERTLVVRQMLDKGDDEKVIAVRFGVHEFVAKKTLIPIAQKHSVKALVGHMQKLCKLDAQVKGAARSKRTLVELAILSIAA